MIEKLKTAWAFILANKKYFIVGAAVLVACGMYFAGCITGCNLAG
jgi:hypothetical protein